MKIINSIHDKTFKNSMTDIRVAREFFEQHLPNKVLSLINLNTLELSPNSYIDEALNERSSDILYKVKLKDNRLAFLYILAEHQSRVDPLMSFRLWTYIIRIWDVHIKQTSSKTLPLIFPLVFYNGRGPYNGPRNIRDLIQAPLEMVNECLFQDFHLIDTHDIQDEELQERHWAGVVTFMFKHVHDREIWLHIQTLISMIKKIEQEDGAIILVNTLLKYWLVVSETKEKPRDFINAMQNGLSSPMKENLMTMAEQLIQEGVERGMQQGMQQGVQQGMQQGVRQGECGLLIDLLEQRFRAVPQDYKSKVKKATDRNMLLKWGVRALGAKTLEEVFED